MQLKFFYCKGGAAKEPVLMIGPDLDQQQVEELESHAAHCAHGQLINGSKGLIFQVEGETCCAQGSIGELERDIQGYFSRKVSALQNAKVVASHKPGRFEEDRSL
mgnify:CR=1 FL=1